MKGKTLKLQKKRVVSRRERERKKMILGRKAKMDEKIEKRGHLAFNLFGPL